MERVKIGWSMRDVSLDEPMSLPGQGYLRVSTGILDPVCVTAMAVDGGAGQDPVVFLSCDMLFPDVIWEVENVVRERHPELPENFLVVNATHTHTTGSKWKTPEKSPDGADIYDGLKYKEFVVEKAAEAVCEAWRNRAEGGIAYGYGYAVVAHSRRVIYFDDTSKRGIKNFLSPNGHGVMYGNTNDPMFSHYEAGADHFLNAMFTFDKEGKLTGIVANVPCPSQNSEILKMQSADYWHDVRQLAAKEFGKDVYILPQCAAAGDLAPRLLHYKRAQERRMELKYGMKYDPNGSNHQFKKAMSERYDIAERIIAGLKEVYGWASKEIYTELPVRHSCEDLKLSRRRITEEERVWCEETIRRMEAELPDPSTCTPDEYRVEKSRFDVIKSRNTRVLERYKTQDEDPTLSTKVHAVQIGDISFVTNRFELFQDYMHRIQARSPFMQTFVVQLAGDKGGTYLATARAVPSKGYSASLFDNIVGPEGGQELVEGSLRMLQELRDRDQKT